MQCRHPLQTLIGVDDDVMYSRQSSSRTPSGFSQPRHIEGLSSIMSGLCMYGSSTPRACGCKNRSSRGVLSYDNVLFEDLQVKPGFEVQALIVMLLAGLDSTHWATNGSSGLAEACPEAQSLLEELAAYCLLVLVRA